MTIKELINHLSTMDDNLEVYIQGYEGGYTDVTLNKIQQLEVLIDFNLTEMRGHWWVGEHENLQNVDEKYHKSKYEVKRGIVLGR